MVSCVLMALATATTASVRLILTSVVLSGGQVCQPSCQFSSRPYVNNKQLWQCDLLEAISKISETVGVVQLKS